MLNIGNSIQEVKYQVISHSNHPKSAPIKNEPEISDEHHSYGGHIYKMHQGEEAYKNKKLQQNAYFQELTRQVQEKCNNKHQPKLQDSERINEKSFKKSETLNFPSETQPDIIKDNEIKYSRYQKKYEIENHTKINVNTTQVFGGVLQRDEAFLNKMKKLQQQQELKETLNLQMQEKARLKQEEKNRMQSIEIEELRMSVEIINEESIKNTSKTIENTQILEKFNAKTIENSPILEKFNAKTIENTPILEKFNAKTIENSPILEKFNSKVIENPQIPEKITGKSHTMPASYIKQEDDENYRTLNEFYQQLAKETQELNSAYSEKDRQIKELEKKIIEKSSKNSEVQSSLKIERKKVNEQVMNEVNYALKFEKNKKYAEQAKELRNSSLNDHNLKKPQQIERLKLSAIDEKIENARKRRLDNTRLKASAKIAKNSEFTIKKEQFSKGNSLRERKISSPIPQTPETELDTVPLSHNEDSNRHNLDTAGNSYFIYPDSQGNFRIGDEIDKFVNDYEKKGSQAIALKSSISNPPFRNSEYDSKFSSSAITFTGKRVARPLVANKYGDIFKVPT